MNAVVATLGSVMADRYGMMDDGHGNGWMWLGVALMFLLVVAVVGLVVWAIARSAQSSRPQPHDRAREILAERLARGEITPDEYRDRVQHLA